MDGLEAARLIKADSGLSETPAVLMVTAFAREEFCAGPNNSAWRRLDQTCDRFGHVNTIIDAWGPPPPGPSSGSKNPA